MKRAIIAIAVVFAGGWMRSALADGRIITVDDDGPADFSTIQAAIDDANDGDTVLVADGTYTGDGNRDIDFHGKAITVKSENGPETCIIDCNGTETEYHRAFTFQNEEGPYSALAGFTITNGLYGYGGGILNDGASPTVTKCIFQGNVARPGGGGTMYTYYGSPTLTHCTFIDNTTDGAGGAIANHCYSGLRLFNCMFIRNSAVAGGAMINGVEFGQSNPILINCIFTENSASQDGGAIHNYSEGNPMLVNCVITSNSAGRYGGAIHSAYNSKSVLTHCIVWNNTAPSGPEIALYDEARATVSYSDIQGGWSGVGNIDADPCFADANNGDYHLKSRAGRWEPNEGRWTTDEVTSPCIDAGDPLDPIGLEPFPNGGRINMGAYGGTAEASKSWFGGPVCEVIVAGDVNGDCKVNFLDFRIVALHWLEEH